MAFVPTIIIGRVPGESDWIGTGKEILEGDGKEKPGAKYSSQKRKVF